MGTITIHWSSEVQPGEVTVITVEDREGAETAMRAAEAAAAEAAASLGANIDTASIVNGRLLLKRKDGSTFDAGAVSTSEAILAASQAKGSADAAAAAQEGAQAASAAAQDVANSSVTGGNIQGDDLYLERKDGTAFRAGNVRGLPGPNTVPTQEAIAAASIAAPGATLGRTISERAGDEVDLDDFYRAADNDDWGITATRAVAYATPLGKAVRLSRLYPYKTKVTLLSGAAIVGSGNKTGFLAPKNAPVSFVDTLGLSDITLSNFLIDGGVTTADTTKKSVRGLQFRDGSNIALDRMFVRNTADWGTSFLRCSKVNVTNHTHTGGNNGYTGGGRDGVHFLDCSSIVVDGAFIESGDDCIGITTETVGSSDVTIRNVVGYSELASVVIANEEGNTTFGFDNIVVENIRGRRGRNIVRLQAINGATVFTNARVSGITGTARVGAGIIIGRVKGFVLSDFNVVGQTHGVQVSLSSDFVIVGGTARSTLATYDGFNVTSCDYGAIVACRSKGSTLWGFQINGGTYVTLTDCQALDCGTLAGPAAGGANGGGLRIINAAYVTVIGGSYVGDPTISKYGLSYGGASRLYISPLTRFAGESAMSGKLAQVNVMQVAMCAAQFKDSGGVLTVGSSMNCLVERLQAGEYAVTFTEPDKVTPKAAGGSFPIPQITVGHPATAGTLATRRIAVVTALTSTGLRFQIINQDTNAMIAADYISVMVWDQP